MIKDEGFKILIFEIEIEIVYISLCTTMVLTEIWLVVENAG